MSPARRVLKRAQRDVRARPNWRPGACLVPIAACCALVLSAGIQAQAEIECKQIDPNIVIGDHVIVAAPNGLPQTVTLESHSGRMKAKLGRILLDKAEAEQQMEKLVDDLIRDR